MLSNVGEMSDATIFAVMKCMNEAKAKQNGKGWIDPHVLTTPEDLAEAPQPRPAVPHGLRSTFKDWATEAGIDPDGDIVGIPAAAF